MLKNAYEKECKRSCHPNRKFECRKCGSKNFYFHDNCLARGNKCKICSKPSNFAAACENKEKPVEVESSVFDLMKELSKSLDVDSTCNCKN